MDLRRKVGTEKKEYAKQLRENMTPSERKLEQALIKKPFGFKAKFRSQVVIRGWIVDFWCPYKKVVIELDGKYHKDRKDEDNRRDIALARLGIYTLRIPSSEVHRDLNGVLKKIKKVLDSREGTGDTQTNINVDKVISNIKKIGKKQFYEKELKSLISDSIDSVHLPTINEVLKTMVEFGHLDRKGDQYKVT